MIQLALIARLVLGFVFALSSTAKLRDPAGFLRGVRRFGILPTPLSDFAAALLIIGEMGLAISLITGWVATISCVAAVSLLLLFLAIMSWNALQPVPLPCYCFGTDETEIASRHTLIRLGLLLAIATLPIVGWITSSSALIAASPTLGAMLLSIATVIIGFWLLRTPSLLQTHRTPLPSSSSRSRRVSFREAPLRSASFDEVGKAQR